MFKEENDLFVKKVVPILIFFSVSH